mmetsp:Transcript_19576/g.27103  ORF Transcript_19576/g.27103 Transcript_19576/m.27103 type:complete len:750 (-) Transcript_19576:172-2421(-)
MLSQDKELETVCTEPHPDRSFENGNGFISCFEELSHDRASLSIISTPESYDYLDSVPLGTLFNQTAFSTLRQHLPPKPQNSSAQCRRSVSLTFTNFQSLDSASKLPTESSSSSALSTNFTKDIFQSNLEVERRSKSQFFTLFSKKDPKPRQISSLDYPPPQSDTPTSFQTATWAPSIASSTLNSPSESLFLEASDATPKSLPPQYTSESSLSRVLGRLSSSLAPFLFRQNTRNIPTLSSSTEHDESESVELKEGSDYQPRKSSSHVCVEQALVGGQEGLLFGNAAFEEKGNLSTNEPVDKYVLEKSSSGDIEMHSGTSNNLWKGNLEGNKLWKGRSSSDLTPSESVETEIQSNGLNTREENLGDADSRGINKDVLQSEKDRGVLLGSPQMNGQGSSGTASYSGWTAARLTATSSDRRVSLDINSLGKTEGVQMQAILTQLKLTASNSNSSSRLLARLARFESARRETLQTVQELKEAQRTKLEGMEARQTKCSKTLHNLVHLLDDATMLQHGGVDEVLQVLPRLGNLARDDKSLLALIDAGIPALVVGVMQCHHTNSEIQAHGCALLALLSGGGARRSSSISLLPPAFITRAVEVLASCTPQVLAAMSSHLDHLLVQVAACECLWALTRLGADVEMMLVASADRIMSSLLAILPKHTKVAQLLERSIGTLLAYLQLNTKEFGKCVNLKSWKKINSYLKKNVNFPFDRYNISPDALQKDEYGDLKVQYECEFTEKKTNSVGLAPSGKMNS